MCMKPIHNLHASFRRLVDVVQAQMAIHNQNSLDTNSLFGRLEPKRGTAMVSNLREIHIKICSARIVMYIQGHQC